MSSVDLVVILISAKETHTETVQTKFKKKSCANKLREKKRPRAINTKSRIFTIAALVLRHHDPKRHLYFDNFEEMLA